MPRVPSRLRRAPAVARAACMWRGAAGVEPVSCPSTLPFHPALAPCPYGLEELADDIFGSEGRQHPLQVIHTRMPEAGVPPTVQQIDHQGAVTYHLKPTV